MRGAVHGGSSQLTRVLTAALGDRGSARRPRPGLHCKPWIPVERRLSSYTGSQTCRCAEMCHNVHVRPASLRKNSDKPFTQTAVGLLALISFLTIAVRTSLRSVPEIFPGGAVIGEVLYDLALAYLGAWIFNLLVVVMPRKRDQQRIYASCDKFIRRIYASADRSIPALYGHIGESAPPKPDAYSLRRVLAAVNPSDEAPLILHFEGSGTIMPANWIQYFQHEITWIERAAARIDPLFIHFDSNLIELLNAVTSSQLASQIVSMPAHVPNQDLTWLHSALMDHWTNCSRLKEYYEGL